MRNCQFCATPKDDAWIVSDEVIAIPDPHPLTTCHVLVAPRRHAHRLYDLDVEEQRKVWAVVQEVRDRISAALLVEGFDVGFAEPPGENGHVHIHVVPRQPGEHVTLPPHVEWVPDATA